MPTLDPTVGGANANTYADLTYANTYVTNRPNHSAWDAATDPQKEEALIWATILLDMAFEWTGSPSDQIQCLMWPRVGMFTKNGAAVIAGNVLPNELKNAQCEYARQLLSGDLAADNDAVKNELLGLKAGSVSLTFRNTEAGTSPEQMDAQVRRKGPDLNYLAKMVPDAVRFQIPKGWYKQNLVSNPLIFMASGPSCGW